MESTRRPRLTPEIADIRRAIRVVLADAGLGSSATPPASGSEPSAPGTFVPGASAPDAETRGLVLVGLSGGPDSLALAAGTAFEAARAGLRAGAVIVDHALQPGSADVAAEAARQATALGLDPVLVVRITVDHGENHRGSAADTDPAETYSGPEAAARTGRYAAFVRALADTGASHVLLGHTLDDQAETVLLGLARGSGPVSLHGMLRVSGAYLRPLLGIRRAQTVAACTDSGLTPWTDPHNAEHRFARVRVRDTVLPALERELGPGVAEALARTADLLREDAAALDERAAELAGGSFEIVAGGIRVPVEVLAEQPVALRNRLIRLAAARTVLRAAGAGAGTVVMALPRGATLAVGRLVTDWHGQGPLDLPGVRVVRHDGWLVFTGPGLARHARPTEYAQSKGPSLPHGTPRH
ncbi:MULTISPECIES: tRNA lysidine(34) synthetase TilS [unclassified Cryobacterium]|uniref:tRNA lysidine(34) synthetase TilS n=1 Tax=unclassified Cryobacterium TaxID=2649013 RepID=UPI00106AEC98|nr:MULTISPECIES: tRNA lysidine(34) synthetase TilS [unclassified Cryobacterium]TFB98870.1 tRNA lysidine(34) synthetase TilS [Cryobacterium sp. MDB2-A-1]TFC07692.1 tRNA lysidine(34) synthetase TilS [Cryobacterium sp. MDB2-33-2]TFC14880.1 tRNA lysidine(34) synthetase TilS [Cryobacterium sp. MDB2-A-2]TFC16610.1 tRNA lysidine(34) synthetase TilS [Cryobacterium sp. MDB2-10]